MADGEAGERPFQMVITDDLKNQRQAKRNTVMQRAWSNNPTINTYTMRQK